MSRHQFREEDGSPVRKGWTYKAGGYTYKFLRAVSATVVHVQVTTPDGSVHEDDVHASGLGIASGRRRR